MGPDLPGNRFTLAVGDGFPTDDGDRVAGNRLDGVVEGAPDGADTGVRIDIHVGDGDGDDQAVVAVAHDLDGAGKRAVLRDFVAVVKEARGEEDENQDQRDHDVVVEA